MTTWTIKLSYEKALVAEFPPGKDGFGQEREVLRVRYRPAKSKGGRYVSFVMVDPLPAGVTMQEAVTAYNKSNGPAAWRDA